jgi:O-antigen/teichoic acid export membrane protein
LSVFTRLSSHLRTPLYRNGYFLTLSSAGSSGLGFVFWILAAHYYSAEVVGLSSAVLSASILLAGVSMLGLNNVLVRFVPLAGRATRRLVSYIYLICVVSSVVITLIFIAGIDRWSPALDVIRANPGWLWSFVLATMLLCIFTLQDYVLTGLRQALWIPIENTLVAVVKVLLLALVAGNLQNAGIFASWNVPVVLSLLPINLLIFGRLIPKHVEATSNQAISPNLRKIIEYAAGNHVGALFTLASTTVLPIVVIIQAGATANAYFYPPWMIMTALQLLALSLTTSMTVEAAFDQTKLRAYCRRLLVYSTCLLAPLITIVLISTPFILRIFGAAYAVQGSALLRLLTLATLPNIVVVLALAVVRIQNRSSTVFLIQASLCVLVLGLSYFLLPILGITGIGVAVLAGQSIVAVCLLLTLLRPILTKERGRYKQPESELGVVSQWES